MMDAQGPNLDTPNLHTPDLHTPDLHMLADALRGTGFAFVQAPEMRAVLEAEGLRDWDAFARTWDDLGLDTYMADGGRYRKRRHAAFAVSAAGVQRKPPQPHYQSRDYNALNGGIARWFEQVTPQAADGPAFQAIVRTCHALFDSLTPAPLWHVEAHQFRIEARPGQAGQPTPEGMHQDGVDWVLVLMVGRVNIASGTTSIHGLDRTLLGSFTLEQPMGCGAGGRPPGVPRRDAGDAAGRNEAGAPGRAGADLPAGRSGGVGRPALLPSVQ